MAALQCEICGGRLMAKAGGIFECDSCGMQYDKTRIQEMVQEIKGTVKVEGTVEVTGKVQVDGSVKVEGSTTKDSLLKRAMFLLEDRKWDEVKEVINQVLMIDPECSQAHIYEFLASMKLPREEDLGNIFHGNFWEYPLWKKALKFASEEDQKRLNSYPRAFSTRLINEAPPSEQLLARRRLSEAFSGQLERETGYWLARSVSGEVFIWIENENTTSWAREVETWPKNVVHVLCCWDMIIGIYPDGTCRAAVKKDASVKTTVENWKDIKLVVRSGRTLIALTKGGELFPLWLPDSQPSKSARFNATGWQDVEKLIPESRNSHDFIIGLTADGSLKSTYDLPKNLPASKVKSFEFLAGDLINCLKMDGSVYIKEQIASKAWADQDQLSAYRVSSDCYLLTTGGTWVQRGNEGPGSRLQHEKHDVADFVWSYYGEAMLHANGSVTCSNKKFQKDAEYVALINGGGYDEGFIAALDTHGRITLLCSEKKIPKDAEIFKWNLFDSAETLEQETASIRKEWNRISEETHNQYEAAAQREKEEKSRKKAERRAKYKADLEKEQSNLKTELSNLKGLFTGKRRKEIETRLAEIETKLKGL